MKRFITLRLLAYLLVSFYLVSVAYAQDTDSYHRPHFGIKIGINMSALTSGIGPFDKNSPNFANGPFTSAISEPYFSASAGLTVDQRVSKSFSFAGELLYNERGGSYDIERDDVILTDTDGNQSNGHDHYAYQLTYIELPLMLQYHLPTDADGNQFRLYAGISPAIRISANTAYTHYVLADDSVTENTNVDVAKLNYSAGLSVNPIVGFWMSSKDLGGGVKLFGDVRFEYTFSDVFTRPTIDDENFNTDMWTINFGFGVRF